MTDKQAKEIGYSIIRAAEILGNNGAGTSMGGLEALGAAIIQSAGKIADSISDLANAIRESDEE